MSASWQSTQENRAVDAYLQYVTTGELPPPPNIDARLEVLDAKIANETRMFVKIQLLQEKRDLTTPTVDAEAVTEGFVKHAGAFGERNGIAYVTWREMGVPAAVLKRAGLKATGVKGLAPDAPERLRAYAPRRPWSEEEKAEYVAIFDAQGVAAAIAHFNLDCTEHAGKQRYFSFRRQLNLPNPSKRGRPRQNASKAT
jgi:hypothetical protein